MSVAHRTTSADSAALLTACQRKNPAHPAGVAAGIRAEPHALRRACPRPDRGLPRHAVPLRGRPARHLPPAAETGFVLHVYRLPGPNWVRFAHFASGVRPEPASSHPQSPIRSPQSRNWLRFARFTPAAPRPTRQSLPKCPSPSKFGFVLHILPQRPPPAGPNWVRFARFASSGVGRPRPTSSAGGRDWVCFARLPSGRAKLGSFCIIGPCPRDLGPPAPPGIGFVLHKSSPPGHGDHGAATGPAPAGSPFAPFSPSHFSNSRLRRLPQSFASGLSCFTLDTSNLTLALL
jgi:hypothetical protein